MFVGIAIEVNSGNILFSQPCETRSKARVCALRVAREGYTAGRKYRITTKSLQSFHEYLLTNE